ncbi:hypothetical protein B0H11DRAFT_1926070 [Mycena galericulata]|nr:hypothetical protein B0H11DRAFT_1926070 [Mycena galericulata]
MSSCPVNSELPLATRFRNTPARNASISLAQFAGNISIVIVLRDYDGASLMGNPVNSRVEDELRVIWFRCLKREDDVEHEDSSATGEGVTRTTGRILNTSRQKKITAIKEKSRKSSPKGTPHPNDDEQHQDEEQPKAPHNHAVVRRLIHPRSSQQARTTTGEGVRYTTRTDEGGETKTLDGFQRDRRHVRARHEEVQYAEHAAQNSKGKGTKPRQDAAQRVEPVKEGWVTPRSAAPRLQAHLRAQRRDARAVVLLLMRIAVAGGGNRRRVALEVVEGRSSRKEHGQRQARVCDERLLVSYLLVKRDQRGEERRTEGKRRRSGGRWTEERCVWRANEKEQGEGTSTEETLSDEEKVRGKRRGRMDDKGQDYEGKHEAGGGGGRMVLARMKRQDHPSRWIRKRSEVSSHPYTGKSVFGTQRLYPNPSAEI